MTGDKAEAAGAFATLLGDMSGISTDFVTAHIKLLFAESVGLDDPAAAQAAKRSLTGSKQPAPTGCSARRRSSRSDRTAEAG